MPIPDILDINGGAVGGTLVGVSGAVWLFLHLRRMLSRDSTDLRSDQAERAVISRLEAEIKRLGESAEKAAADVERLRAQRTADTATIAELEAERIHLSRERDRLMRDIRRAVLRLPPEVQDELETDFAALAAVDERIEPKAKR